MTTRLTLLSRVQLVYCGRQMGIRQTQFLIIEPLSGSTGGLRAPARLNFLLSRCRLRLLAE